MPKACAPSRRRSALTCVHTITTLTGSALLAVAFASGRLSAEEAWTAAHVDEDWQIEHWGTDEEAFQRREGRWQEMQAATATSSTRCDERTAAREQAAQQSVWRLCAEISIDVALGRQLQPGDTGNDQRDAAEADERSPARRRGKCRE